MTTQPAKAPKLSLPEMIDQRLAAEDQLADLIATSKRLSKEIAKAMTAKKLKSCLGNSGRGYRIASWLQCDFKPEVVEYVRRINKVELFVPEPLVTKARLRDAFQNGHLSAAQHDKIKTFAGPDYPVNRLYLIEKEASSDV